MDNNKSKFHRDEAHATHVTFFEPNIPMLISISGH